VTAAKTFYFIAKGRSLEAVMAWGAKREAALGIMAKVFEEVGAERGGGDGAQLSLYLPDGKQPQVPGWRPKASKRGWWLVDRTTPEGKAMAKRLADAKIPGAMDLEVGVSPVIKGFSMECCIPERIGDAWTLQVPELKGKPSGTPWDAQPLKASDYWALKEAAEAAKAPAEA
jgi:hypothetical protein